MPRSQAEFRLQCAVADLLTWLAEPGVHWFAVPNGENRDAITGARLKRMGVKRGEPDIVILHNKRAIGLELKAEKGRTSPEQKAVAEAWTLAGSRYHVAKGYEEAVEFLGMLGVIKPVSGRFLPRREVA